MSDDVFVRKDVFDANMEGIRALMAESEARHREYMARQDARIEEVRGEVKELRGEFKSLARQVDGLGDTIAAYVTAFSNRMTLVFGLIGGLIGLAAVMIAGAQVYLAVKGG